ncbi:hypothetical protein IJJ36_03050 [Candidatus Saccharibacteria bacterium]|nr:hypothetical protein [Candidatus Saccharibacteria bacterium]
MKSGITEKRLKDKRFKKTEEAILRVFFETKECISVKSLAIKIGVARSTIYCHHKSIREILPDYEKYILKKYSKMVRQLAHKKEKKSRVLYINILLFVLRNKRIFEILLKHRNKIVFEEMILRIKPMIEGEMGLPENSEKLYKVFASEIAALIEGWGEEDFAEKNMSMVLSDIVFLTKTARTRLVELLD